MDARVDYGNPIAAKFAKRINSAGAVVSGSTLPPATPAMGVTHPPCLALLRTVTIVAKVLEVRAMELLERASFLQTLGQYADQARQGDGRLVLVSGESGMGKTVLLEAFQRRTTGIRWLWGACDGLLTPRPLGPLFDIAPQAGGDLAALCAGGAARDRLFTAFLAGIDSPAPFTAVVIEDVHWADEATLDLLSFAGRRLGRTRALLLATYRDDELADDHPLRVVLGDLATQRATRRMQLAPLSPEAVGELVGERDVDAAELHRVTGGNPFYVSEMLAAGWPSVPATIRDVVAARLARLSPGTRRTVETAAVMGARVDLPLLSEVQPDSPVDDCVATGILVADSSGVRFRHELVRMAVEEAIPSYRQTELHVRLLAALEERGDADPAVLAHHAEGAGDEKAVLRHAPEAARRSAALGAHREAAAQYERALRFAHKLDRPGMAALQEGVAGEYALLDRWQETEAAAARRAGAAPPARRRPERRGGSAPALRCAMAAVPRRGRDPSRGGGGPHPRRLATRPRSWPRPTRALGALYSEEGRTDEGLELLEKARALGELLHEPGLVSYALNMRGVRPAGTRPRRNGADRRGPGDRAGRGPARNGRPRVRQLAGSRVAPEHVRRSRALLRRGNGVLRRTRARRVQRVPAGLAGGHPRGYWDGGMKRRTSALRCWAAAASRRSTG